MTPVIQVENLSKKYVLGSHQNNTLGGAIADAGRWAVRTAKHWSGADPLTNVKAPPPILWALNDVSMSIGRGEIVGVVGRNGNGKSTLLKILSRITMPTRGRVRIQGSLASLLEVGTGFHPELTGRENIFLNGAILGMRHHQIRARLDEIIAFSEVEKFMDTPVKRYSSGMYVRLAFAVAAHLDPDILLVDEVLAVGDGAFQKKCLGKMQDAGASERTVLFVSHSLPAVRSICTRVILLDQGRVILDGPTDEVLGAYNKMLQAPRRIADEGMAQRLYYANGAVRVSAITCRDASGAEAWNFKPGQDVRLRLDYEAYEGVPSLGVYLVLTSLQSGEQVTSVKRPVTTAPLQLGDKGTIEIQLPKIPLRPGEYSLTIWLGDATFERRFDCVDANQNLPWLCITSDEKDLMTTGGYFSIPANVESFA
jgi:lipopolysaccharide transport system ATP-binding protein